MGQANARTVPGVPATVRRKGFKAELDGLRERMRGLGFSTDEIAAEIARRYRACPREAYRLAWGWSLEQAAARFNERATRQDADPQTRASLNHFRLSEFEHWPLSTRKPSVHVLFMQAELYETDVLCLLDPADHESLPQQDRLVLLRRPRAATPFGERLLVLTEARGLSLRETARRVPCDNSYLSRIVHGRKGVSGQVAARLDDLLEAGGELVALAGTAEVVTRDDEPAPPGNPPGQAGDTHVAPTGGMSLSLPYVPGRLVIEVSGPAGETGQVTGGAADGEIASGRLALVRDTGSSKRAGTEVTGA